MYVFPLHWPSNFNLYNSDEPSDSWKVRSALNLGTSCKLNSGNYNTGLVLNDRTQNRGLHVVERRKMRLSNSSRIRMNWSRFDYCMTGIGVVFLGKKINSRSAFLFHPRVCKRNETGISSGLMHIYGPLGCNADFTLPTCMYKVAIQKWTYLCVIDVQCTFIISLK